jgi:hypothetical protein
MEIVLVQKVFANPELESRQANLARIFVEDRTTDLIHPKILSVNAKSIEVVVSSTQKQVGVHSENP